MVEGNGGLLRGAAAQRKPLALLALLALAYERALSRDKIVAYLWPEAEPEKAAHRLNQLLYTLRRDLGSDALFLGSSDLRLNPEILTTDVADFRSHIRRGEVEQAVAIYGGPFLDGFYLDGALEFERWMEEERANLAKCYGSALEAVALTAVKRGDLAAAVEYRRKLTQVDPLNSRGALGLMEVLHAAGDPTAALQVAKVHQAHLREEVDAPLDPAITSLAEQIRLAMETQESTPAYLGKLEPQIPAISPAAHAAAAAVVGGERAHRRAPPGRWLAISVLLVLAVVLAVVLALAFAPTSRRVELGRRVQLTLEPGLEIDPALSPDGKLVAFAAGPLSKTRVYVRQVNGAAPVAITSSDRGFARVPRWSPDGGRLLFLSDRGLEVIPSLGGPPKLVLPIKPDMWSDGTWSPDGRTIAYALGDSVYVRSLEGGAARGLARLPEAHSCTWSPDGRWLACVSGNRQFVTNGDFGNKATSSVWVIPAAGGVPVRVTDDESLNMSPVWLPGRPWLLFVSDRDGGRDIYRVSLTRAGHSTGDVVRLTTGLNAAGMSVSADGHRLAYALVSETSNVWTLPIPTSGIARVSRAEPVTRGTQVIERFNVSPDGRWLVFDSDRSGLQQIYRVPFTGGEPEQLTAGDEPAFDPSVSPDGREIAYHSLRGGTRQIFVLPAEGGRPTQVTSGSAQYRAAEWSPDGQTLAMEKASMTPARETHVVTRDAAGHWGIPRALVKGGAHGVWAPDGRAVLTETGWFGAPPSLEIVAAGGGERRVVMSVRDPASDVAPLGFYAWSADGRVVYFVGRDPANHSVGIWGVPAMGGTPRLAAQFDDPSRPWHPFGFRVHDGRFYFTVGDRQSDVWIAMMLGSR